MWERGAGYKSLRDKIGEVRRRRVSVDVRRRRDERGETRDERGAPQVLELVWSSDVVR